MRRDLFKLIVFAGIVVFAVLYGMDLSSKGIRDVNGEWGDDSYSQTTGAKASGDEWQVPERQGTNTTQRNDTASTQDDIYYMWDEEPYELPRHDRKPIVDRLSGATAELLHGISKSGIKLVVSLFDKVTG
jgi:hypothetical protein